MCAKQKRSFLKGSAMTTPGQNNSVALPQTQALVMANVAIAEIYPTLKKIASRELKRLGSGLVTMRTSDLLHEAYLRFLPQKNLGFSNQAHLQAVLAIVLRRVVVDEVRRKLSEKRGRGMALLSLRIAAEEQAAAEQDVDLLQVEAALTELEATDAETAHLVELRFFGGFSLEAIAEMQQLSISTMERRWRFARAWLRDRLAALRS
jgi:RNA polymerase sigma factor (TIGR02999 family)